MATREGDQGLATVPSSDGFCHETAWIDRFLNGDESAFAIFHEKYFQRMVVFLRESIFRVSTADAEDLAIELEIKVARGLRKFDRSRSLRVWLYALARNVKIDHYRKINCRIPSSEEVPLGSGPEVFEDASSYQRALVWQCLNKIRPEHREIIILTIIEGFTAKETAVILETSAKSIEGKKKEALEQLRGLLQSKGTPCENQPMGCYEQVRVTVIRQ